MPTTENALSLTVVDPSAITVDVLKRLYRITGRSSVELRDAILAGAPVYSAPLFGNDHIHVVPRLERTAALLDELGVRYTVHEWTDGVVEEISAELMRQIIQSADGQFG